MRCTPSLGRADRAPFGRRWMVGQDGQRRVVPGRLIPPFAAVSGATKPQIGREARHGVGHMAKKDGGGHEPEALACGLLAGRMSACQRLCRCPRWHARPASLRAGEKVATTGASASSRLPARNPHARAASSPGIDVAPRECARRRRNHKCRRYCARRSDERRGAHTQEPPAHRG